MYCFYQFLSLSGCMVVLLLGSFLNGMVIKCRSRGSKQALKMTSPSLVAAVAAIGNYIQGWDASALAGAMLYMRSELHLDQNPTIHGLITSSSFLGCIVCTSAAGVLADRFGRRRLLIVAGTLLFIGSLGMALSPNIIALIASRILTGCAEGLVSALVPLLIAETAPTDIRGRLATLPQLTNSSGTFSGYFVVFLLSLIKRISWRLILGALTIPAFIYVSLCLYYLPESPRWLVSKGNMNEAKRVLQSLLDKEDVAGELALLVEGLGTGTEAVIEEYVIEPKDTHADSIYLKPEGNTVQLYGIEDEQPWIARHRASMIGKPTSSRLGSQIDSISQFPSFVDPTVALAKSFQSLGLESHHEPFDINALQWDVENQDRGDEPDHQQQEDDLESEEYMESIPGTPGVTTPLLHPADSESTPSRQRRGFFSMGDRFSPRNLHSRSRVSRSGENVTNEGESMGLGGGWQVAWQWQEPNEQNQTGSLKRVFLFPESAPPPPSSVISSMRSIPNLAMYEPVHVAALIGEPALCVTEKELKSTVSEQGSVIGPAVLHPAKVAEKGLSLSDFMDIRVRRALVVGMSLQLLQQFCGIGAVLNFTPEILEQSGIDSFLKEHGFQANSASLLASAVTCLPMLPFIVFSMFLMDKAGRRQMLLYTTPLLFVLMLFISTLNMLLPPGTLQGILLVLGVTLFLCFFNMGFGAVPNIICSEIFPTRVRGVALGLCGLVMWGCNMIISFMFPILNRNFGLSGVFGFFGFVCGISWVFVYLKVPETKGFPLEVITEFFALPSAATAARDV